MSPDFYDIYLWDCLFAVIVGFKWSSPRARDHKSVATLKGLPAGSG